METQTLNRLEMNKRTVRDFYELAFNQNRPQEAASKYIDKVYIQHNPSAGDGAEAFINFVIGYHTAYPELHSEIKRIIAEGDLVVTHSHFKLNSADRGMALADIFRLENGKIVEHWDVMQPIPEKSANNNTMF